MLGVMRYHSSWLRPIRAAGVAASALAWALAATACGKTSAAEASPQARDAILALSVPPSELQIAAGKVIKRCMKDKGFEYQPSQEAPSPLGSGDNLSGVLGILDEQDADRFGYGALVTNPGDSSRATNSIGTPQSPDYTKALTGFPMDISSGSANGTPPKGAMVEVQIDGASYSTLGGGCVGEAWKRIYGSPEDYLRLGYLPQGISRFARDIQDDSAVEEAWERYGTCMSGVGYADVHNLRDSQTIAKKRFTRALDEVPSADERAMAVADARCQRSSGAVSSLNDAMLRAGSEWLNEHEADLLAVAEVQRESLRRAKEVIESGTGS